MKANEFLPDHIDHIDQNERDGVVIRKGTVGAFLLNAQQWIDSGTDSAQRCAAERDIVEALPALHALRLFEVLSVRDTGLQQLIDRHLPAPTGAR